MHCEAPFHQVVLWQRKTVTVASRRRSKHSITHSLIYSLAHKCLFYRVTLLPLCLFNDAVTYIKPADRAKCLECCSAVHVAYRKALYRDGGSSRCERNCGRIAECIYNTISLTVCHLKYITKWYHLQYITIYHWNISQYITCNIISVSIYFLQYITYNMVLQYITYNVKSLTIRYHNISQYDITYNKISQYIKIWCHLQYVICYNTSLTRWYHLPYDITIYLLQYDITYNVVSQYITYNMK